MLQLELKGIHCHGRMSDFINRVGQESLAQDDKMNAEDLVLKAKCKTCKGLVVFFIKKNNVPNIQEIAVPKLYFRFRIGDLKAVIPVLSHVD